MEKGSLRVDANISIRRPGDSKLGTKTEVKNLNSLRQRRAGARGGARAPDRAARAGRARGTGDAALQRGHRHRCGRSARRRRATTTGTSPIPTCRRSCSPPSGSPSSATALPELPGGAPCPARGGVRTAGLRRARPHQRGSAGRLLRVGGRGRGRAQDRGQLGHGRRHDDVQRDRRLSRRGPPAGRPGRARARGSGEPSGRQAGLRRARPASGR